MKEDFLQYIWGNSLYKSPDFITYNGKAIRILEPGKLNRDAGPDFFNAKIKMEDVILVGNVEVHLRSSDWYRHNHHTDKSYNNVILSVVKTDDVRIYDSNGREVECIVLDYVETLYNEYVFMRESCHQPGCFRNLELLNDSWFYTTLQSIAVERLERKVNDIRQMWQQIGNDWEECFYRLLCKYWSGNVNSEPFFQLALRLPYKILLKYADRLPVIEALLLGTSGLLTVARDDSYTSVLKKEYEYFRNKYNLVEMNAAQWKFMRIRPDAFPTVRLALLAAFLCHFGTTVSRLIEATSLEAVFDLLDAEASGYWSTHYSFGKLSAHRVKRTGLHLQRVILINAIIPFVFLYGKERGEEQIVHKALEWLEQTQAEENYIVRAWRKYGFEFDSAMQTQALIQIRKEYCEKHLCLRCRIGREILKNISR